MQMGIIRSKVHISDLELVDEPVITTPSMQRTGAGKIQYVQGSQHFHRDQSSGQDRRRGQLQSWINIWMTPISHIMKSVRIVHGKGTGALRKGVHNYLKRQKHVASFRLGEFGEGDAGVTIVDIQEIKRS